MALVYEFAGMVREAERIKQEAEAARTANIHRIAAKNLEKVWHSYAASCPHCKKGLLPEDFQHVGSMSRELEIMRRKKQ